MSLMDQLTDLAIGQMSGAASRKTGLSQGLVEKMLPVAMSALLGGLGKNTSNREGAESLSQALGRHDGSLLDNISRLEQDDVITDGQKILRHVFGNKQETTQRALASAWSSGSSRSISASAEARR